MVGFRMQNTANQTEILWDDWGVPHVYATRLEQLFPAFGYAQMHSHGNLILQLYGQGRGRAAEYWGEDYLQSDRYTRLMGIPQRAKDWYQAQSPEMQQYLDGFAEGINRYGRENGDKLKTELKTVLPVTGVDILAHVQRVIQFHFLVNPQQLQQGSNAWAISPDYSTRNHALLLANPHLRWGDLFLFYESHLKTPNFNAYGAALVGMPTLAIAFNDQLGWTATVNPILGTTRYQLTLEEGGYLFDGEVRPFETTVETLKVKQEDGSYRSEELTLQTSVHGVVIERQENSAVALRVTGLDHPYLPEQFLQMAQAQNLEEFEAALSRLQLPMFNIIYGDKTGNIAYIYNGLIPIRKEGNWQDWSQLVPGDTSTTLWTEYHPYEDLPRLVNPSTKWVQNTNDPPWTSTFPPVLKSADFPNYFAPQGLNPETTAFRTQSSIKMLKNTARMSFEQMVKDKFSSHLEMADHLLDDLINAAKASDKTILQEAANVLADWDRKATPTSKGTPLFFLWSQLMADQTIFATPWNADQPLTTPHSLANPKNALAQLKKAALQLKSTYGTINITWSEYAKLTYAHQQKPGTGASGTLGSFQVVEYMPVSQDKLDDQLDYQLDYQLQSVAGDSYIAALEFSDPIRAKVLTTYGNATQPHSPHVGDQLSLYVKGEMREPWLTRRDIEAHLENRMVLEEK
ncbi:acylase [Spirulina sp. CS-785/01]|uniref:acylase n=1 Tax=Spirulina sp. CS-785/01 TaxID=3021716 RepID=UPI00232ACBFB|nr:acylase [Spirulina sp. CS-785/01]MDB9315110.1 acylase [Spirulina sp. CS-785/01]